METEQTISQIVAEVAAAMKDAAAEYGPQAADLALWAYQVNAIQRLLTGVLLLAVLLGIYLAWRWLWNASAAWVKEHSWGEDTETRDMSRFLGTGLALIAGSLVAAGALTRLFDVAVWLAALGRPELLIATRALQAAGLM